MFKNFRIKRGCAKLKTVTAFLSGNSVFTVKMQRSVAFPKEKPAAEGCGGSPEANLTLRLTSR